MIALGRRAPTDWHVRNTRGDDSCGVMDYQTSPRDTKSGGEHPNGRPSTGHGSETLPSRLRPQIVTYP